MSLQPTTDQELSPLVPIERETLQAQAYAQLREAVMSGRFRPGRAITVRAAANALGTSVMPVRGALQRLEAEGALSARDQRRTLMIPVLTRDELAEVRDIRVVMEGFAASRAAVSITPEELDVVKFHYDSMSSAAHAGDVEGYTRANWLFHATIYRASRMDRLLGIIESLWLRIGPYVHQMLPDQPSLVGSLPHHGEALEALRRRDPIAASDAIASDIKSCAALLAHELPGSASAAPTIGSGSSTTEP
jgi:DNA-binding GntR family transcriptional regulator